MAYVITQKCIGCLDTACVEVCPCTCIIGPIEHAEIRAVAPSERRTRFPGIQLFVDPDDCIDCGACVPECPEQAIYHDRDVPAAHRDDIARNADFFARLRQRA